MKVILILSACVALALCQSSDPSPAPGGESPAPGEESPAPGEGSPAPGDETTAPSTGMASDATTGTEPPKGVPGCDLCQSTCRSRSGCQTHMCFAGGPTGLCMCLGLPPCNMIPFSVTST